MPEHDAPEEGHQDPDDHEDAPQRDPADARLLYLPWRSSVSSVRWFTLDDWCFPTATPQATDLTPAPGASSPGQEPVSFANEVRVPWSTRPLTRRKIAPSISSADDQLRPGEFAVLGLRRLLFVDQPPDPFEDLGADHSGDQAEDDADRGEDELHRVTASCGHVVFWSFGSSRGSSWISFSARGRPSSISALRSRSAFIWWPKRIARLVIQNQSRRTTRPARVP